MWYLFMEVHLEKLNGAKAFRNHIECSIVRSENIILY